MNLRKTEASHGQLDHFPTQHQIPPRYQQKSYKSRKCTENYLRCYACVDACLFVHDACCVHVHMFACVS